jgi:hypothetical protein
MISPGGCARWIGFSLISLALTANLTLGQVIVSPVAVVDTDLGVFDASVPLTNMINQSGIDIPFVSGATDFADYFRPGNRAFAQNGGANNWQSNFSFDLPLIGYVDFDLGASRRINALAIWNVSVKDVTVKLYEELNGPEQVVGSFTLTNHLNFPFSYPADVVTFGASHQGRYLRLAITSAYQFSPSDTFAYAIIGEVVVSAEVSAGSSLTIRLTPDGDVTVAFSGTLESATSIEGPFTAVPGNPQGTHVIAQDALATRQFFRSRSD